MSEEEKHEEQKKTGEQTQLEEIAQQPQLEGKKSNYFSNVSEIATNVCAIVQCAYQKAKDVKCGIEAKMKLASEIKAAEQYSVADLKREEFSVVGKIKQLDSIVTGAEKKLEEYQQVLAVKESDLSRLKQESEKAQGYNKMNSLRDKIHQREFEIQITKNVTEQYKTLLSKVN